MAVPQYWILILCFMGVLPNQGESAAQPFIQIGGKYYLINTAAKMNWFAATLYCRNFNSNLVVIETQAELKALNSYLTTNNEHLGKYFWLGIADLADEGKFMSYSDGRPMPYAKWSSGQPDDSGDNEDCVHLWVSKNEFQMNDNTCTKNGYAICEKRKRSCDEGDLKDVMENFRKEANVQNCPK